MPLKKSSRRSKKYLSLFLVILLPLAVVFLYRQIHALLKIRNFECRLDSQPCPENIAHQFNDLIVGKSLLNTNPAELSEQLSVQYPYFENIILTLEPLRLSALLDLTRSRPIAYVKGSHDYALSVSGVVTGLGTNTDNLVLLTPNFSVNELNIGQKFSQPEIIAALEIIKELKYRSLEINGVEITDTDKLSFRLKTGETIIFSPQKSITEQVDSLQLIFSRTKIEGKRFRELDLRYQKAVLVF